MTVEVIKALQMGIERVTTAVALVIYQSDLREKSSALFPIALKAKPSHRTAVITHERTSNPPHNF